MLIDALRREGMSDLLLHLTQTEPTDDRVMNRQIEIAQYRIQFSDAKRPLEERTAALEQALQHLRQLIEDEASHEQRPLWQTDLAELELFEYLEGLRQFSAEFYDLGVPTAEQRSAFEAEVAEVFEHLVDADQRFAQLQGDLPRQPDHTEKRIDTGLWDRMINQYYNLRTQFFLSHAAYYVALLPDHHRYYANLGNNSRVLDQENTIAAERRRLLELAVERIEPICKSNRGGEAVRLKSLSIAGRARALMGVDAALDNFDLVFVAQAADMNDLTAHLARARWLGRAGHLSEAVDELEQLADHAMVRSNLLQRILLLDVRHRLLLESASDNRDVFEAYDLYRHFLNDPNLGDKAKALKFYIYRRWESNLTDQEDLSRLPAAVVLAIGEMARVEAQDLSNEAILAGQNGNDVASRKLQGKVIPKLDRAQRVLGSLLQRDEANPAIRAGAIYNLGWVDFLTDPSNPKSAVDAAARWCEVATGTPDQPDAEHAIATAVERLRFWHDKEAFRPQVDEAFRHAITVMFENLPTSKAADNQRFYYAAHVLAPAGRLAEAIEVFCQIPPGHVDYFPAQTETLYTRLEWVRKSDGAERRRQAKKLEEDADRLAANAQRALERSPGEAAPVFRNAAGHSRLVLAELALLLNQPDRAFEILECLPEKHVGDDELVGAILSRRIFVLATIGELSKVTEEASYLMQHHPQEASVVIDQILTDLDRQTDHLRKQAAASLVQRHRQQLKTQADTVAQASSELSSLLIEWAEDQRFDLEEMLPYRLIHIKSLRLSGHYECAMAELEPVIEAFPNDAEVVHHAAETYYLLGGRENRVGHASRLYVSIIDAFASPPFPDIFWNAWLRMFQIFDEFDERTEDIPLRVRELSRRDPTLGGEVYRHEMKRLANKYAQ